MVSQTHPLLIIDKVQFQWKDDLTFTPKNESFDFKIENNEIVSISAPSGFGKTTLLKHLLNLNQNVDVPYTIFGTAKLYTDKISYLPQNAQESLHPTHTVKKQILLFQKSLQLKTIDWNEIETTLVQLGFEHPKEILARTPTELSGGQRQRICLLLLLIKKPDLIILDEPTAAIDFANSQHLFKFLKNWALNTNGSVLCISHQTEWIQAFCNRVINYHKSKTSPINYSTQSANEEIVLSVNKLHYKYSDRDVLKALSYDFRRRNCYAITGYSGRGKSTLGKILGGHLTNYQGHLRTTESYFEPSEADSVTLDNWRKNFVYVPQNSYELLNGTTSFLDELNWICKMNNTKMPDELERLNWCTILKIDPKKLAQKLSTLSGGERQKLNILQYLIRKPKMLILDEPTSALDESSKIAFWEAIQQLIKEIGLCILVLTHDPLIIERASIEIVL